MILQGVLYALGACKLETVHAVRHLNLTTTIALLWQPALSYLSEWFVERRGMANGAMFAGTALGGLFLPLILPSLIAKHGAAVTLRYLSVAAIATLIPALPFIKPRLPESRVHGAIRRAEDSRAWLRDWRFGVLLFINTLQGLAYFVPIIYLPSEPCLLRFQCWLSSSSLAFTSAVNSSAFVAALPVALLNGEHWRI